MWALASCGAAVEAFNYVGAGSIGPAADLHSVRYTHGVSMPRWVKVVLLAALVAALVGVGGIVGLGAVLGRGLCGSTEVERIAAPDGRYDAVVYEYSCGATTGFSTQVAIVKAHASPPDSRGNVLSADDNEYVAAVGPQGTVTIELQWLSTDSLVVAIDPSARVFQQVSSVQGIHIVHRTLAPVVPNQQMQLSGRSAPLLRAAAPSLAAKRKRLFVPARAL